MEVQVAPPSREEALASYEAERTRQVNWRLDVRAAAAQMLATHEDGPCIEGVNDWLADRGIPYVHEADSYADISAEDGLAEARATVSARIPALENADWYTATGVASKTAELRASGDRWLTGMIQDLEQLPRTRDDIPQHRITRLVAQLRGEQLPAEPAAEQRVVLDVTTTFRVSIPASSLQGATDAVILTTAAQQVSSALRPVTTAYNGRLEGDIRTTVDITRP